MKCISHFLRISVLFLQRVWVVSTAVVAVSIVFALAATSCRSGGIDLATLDCEKMPSATEKQKCRESKLANKKTEGKAKEDLSVPQEFSGKKKSETRFNETPLAKQYLNKAMFYHWNGEYYKAIDFFRKSVAEDPTDARAWFAMGNTYNELSQFHDAIESYNKAVALQPAMFDAHYNKAMIYKQMYNYREAVEALKAAVEVKSVFPKAQYQLGTIYEALNQKEEAGYHYLRAHEIWHGYVLKNPDYFKTRGNLERLYLSCRGFLMREGLIKEDAKTSE